NARSLRVFCVNCLHERGSLTADVIHTCRHRALSQVDTTLEKPSEKMNHQPGSQTQGAHRIRFHLTHWARPFLVHKKSRHIAPIRIRENNDLVIRRSRRRSKHIEQPHPTGGVDIMRDSTGLFYWVADRPFQVACLSLREMMQCTFCDHILVCLTKQQGTSKLGLASFVMPLRSTRIPMQDLKPIVFLGDQTLVEQEWCSLRNFPQVYILSGSPLSRAYLRAAGVETCSTCVVLSCADGFHGGQTLMADKESILCTLNIRRMLAECTEQDLVSATDQQPMIVTELSDIQSSYLLSVTNDYRTRNGMACFSPFYAAGSMFASTTLTSLASNVFFDPTVLAFIETVLLGGPSHEVEKVFAEDSGFFPGLRGHAVTSIPFPEFEFQRDRERVVGRKYPQKQDQKAGQKQRKPSPDGSLFRVPDMNEDSMLIVESLPVSQDQSSLNSVQKLTSSSPDLHERGGSTIAMDRAVRSAIQVKPEIPVPFMRFISLNDDSTNSAEWPSTSVNFTGLRRQLTDTHVNGDNHVQMGRLRYSNVRNWRPLSTNSFLSYTTESGSVKVHLSRARLLPLSALGAQLNQLIHQVNVELTFDQMFYTVLQETGTICVGLYRRVARLAEDEDQSKPNTEESFRDLGAQIPRFVCTFPDSNTPIFPDDQVYCFTAVMENPDAEW
ncbi:putative calcium-activated potassium channel alpha subunit, partial [Fasciola gigantica]